MKTKSHSSHLLNEPNVLGHEQLKQLYNNVQFEGWLGALSGPTPKLLLLRLMLDRTVSGPSEPDQTQTDRPDFCHYSIVYFLLTGNL